MPIKKIFFSLLILTLLSSAFIFSSGFALAKCTCKCQDGTDKSPQDSQATCDQACSPKPPGVCTPIVVDDSGGKTGTGVTSAELDNPLGSDMNSITAIIAKIIKVAIGLIGILSLLMFIYAGFLWLTARGNDAQIKKGRDTLIWAVAGILLVFSSYVILSYVFKILTF